MITDEAVAAVTDGLAEAGFVVLTEYVDDISSVEPEVEFPAFLRVKKAALGELTADGYGSRCCRAEVTVAVRALGGSAGFYDAELLAEKTDRAASAIFFGSAVIIKSLACGEIKRNMVLGRLEQPIEVTLVTTVNRGV